MSVRTRIRILLVEDDPDDALLTTEVLRELDVPTDVDVMTNGENAIAFLRGHEPFADAPSPDLVLLDLKLPKMDGRQVLAEMKADPDLRRIPVIVLTTSAADGDVLGAYEHHANAYVRKPVGYAALLAVFRAIESFWLSAALLPPVAGNGADRSSARQGPHSDRRLAGRQLASAVDAAYAGRPLGRKT